MPKIESGMFTTMDPKLVCPTLTIMLTKTIKALCEVNINFEKKLEISGSLHVRSDGEKILTCIIDEESIRPIGSARLQHRNTPETALAQQSAVMALLTASQQMAANRSPNLVSPPARNFTPNVSAHLGAPMTPEVAMATTLALALQQQSGSAPVRSAHHYAQNALVNDAHAPALAMLQQSASPQEAARGAESSRLPPVNSLIPNREVLLGMLQDKSRGSSSASGKQHQSSTSSQHHSHHHQNKFSSNHAIKDEFSLNLVQSQQQQQHKGNSTSVSLSSAAHAQAMVSSAVSDGTKNGGKNSSATADYAKHQHALAGIKQEPGERLSTSQQVSSSHTTLIQQQLTSFSNALNLPPKACVPQAVTPFSLAGNAAAATNGALSALHPGHLNIANLPPFPVLVNTAGVASPWPVSAGGVVAAGGNGLAAAAAVAMVIQQQASQQQQQQQSSSTTTIPAAPQPGATNPVTSGTGGATVGGAGTGNNAGGGNSGGGGGGAKTPRSDSDSPPQDPEIVTTINSKGQKKFQCMFCGILLSTKNYLKNHINAVHTKARVYPCEICERYFYSAGALRIHKLRHHWAGSKKHKCSHCHDTFLLPVELRRHLLKKHGDNSGAGDNEEIVSKGGGGGGGGGGGSDRQVAGTPGLTIEQLRQFQIQEHVRAQQLLEQEHALAQLQQHLNAAAHTALQLLEQEHALVQLQQHMNAAAHTAVQVSCADDQPQELSMRGGHVVSCADDQPLELSMRGGNVVSEEDESDAPEPGEITHMTEDSSLDFHTENTHHSMLGVSQAASDIDPAHLQEMTSSDIMAAASSIAEIHQSGQASDVIVQPEPPPDLTHMDEMHPNQNELGIPDDEEEEMDDEEEEEESHDLHQGNMTLKSRVQSHTQFLPTPTTSVEVGHKFS